MAMAPPTVIAPITEDELLRISAANANMRFELVQGELVTMPPTGYYSGRLELEYGTEVNIWARNHNAEASSPSTGFKLPNGDIRSPDVAVILSSNPNYGIKIKKYHPGAPDFLIEIRSESDVLADLKAKMVMWIENGAELAFMIDPIERKAYVYRRDGSVTEYPYTAALSGGDVLPGFSVCPAALDPSV